MSTLKGLNPFGRSLVTEDFRRGDPATVDAGPYVEDLGLGREVPPRAATGSSRRGDEAVRT